MPKFNSSLGNSNSALIAGAISESGAAHLLLNLGGSKDIFLIASELVIVESGRSMAQKSPSNISD
jgi:hypothetical protein